MLSVIVVIVVTIFAVLGAYYLSDLLASLIYGGADKCRYIVVGTAENRQNVWNSVLDLRRKFKGEKIVILCDAKTQQTVKMLSKDEQDVIFAVPDTIADIICDELYVKNKSL